MKIAKKLVRVGTIVLIITVLCVSTAAAAGLESTKLYTGSKKLLTDAMTVIIAICVVGVPVVFAVCAIASNLQQDEMHQAKYRRMRNGALVTLAIVLTAASITAGVASYF
jgi:hydrogenase-4 membrane subunit HyfE